MPVEIKLDNFPAGYAAHAAREGEQVGVITREFTSSEDGDIFISRLEGIPTDLINRLPQSLGIRPSVIDHFLAIIRPDKTATIYVNELDFITKIRVKRAMEKGELIYDDDVADIQKISFDKVSIANDVGVVFVFSVGWRKGFFYDVSPLTDSNAMRDYDLEVLLGHYYTYLSHQHLFKLTEDEWELLLSEQWFPFISLKKETNKNIINYLRNQLEIDELLGTIKEEVTAQSDKMLQRWSENPVIKPHFELINQAVSRYLQEDYISATSILYPRLEGVMRNIHAKVGSGKKATQGNLITSVIEGRQEKFSATSLLLPKMFRRFLKDVYFANFEPNKPAKLSRHSVAHGVASPQDFSLKAATLGLLILDQIFYFIPSDDNKENAV